MPEIPARSSWCEPFPNDEPTDIDGLKRDALAEELARISLCCKTPMVIGLYGGWGSGKTSLMRIIEKKLEKEQEKFSCIPMKKGCNAIANRKEPLLIRFNPWAFQFADNPSLYLIQTLISTFNEKWEKKGPETALVAKKLRKIITSIIKGTTVTLNAPYCEIKIDTNKIADKYRETLEEQVKQSQNYQKITEQILRKNERIIFFIDDLDRCMPDKALSLLEALKLYLNQEGCVYFLAVDNLSLEKGIEGHIGRSLVTVNGTNYLDKIVQLPFRLPHLHANAKIDFVKKYLECLPEWKTLVPFVCAGLDDTPRSIKRFLIDLRMNYNIGMKYKGYNVHIAAFMLFIQWGAQSLFDIISRNSELILTMTTNTEDGHNLRTKFIGGNARLKAVFELAMKNADIPRDEDEVKKYVHLSRYVVDNTSIKVRDDVQEFNDALGPHQEWISSGGQRGKKAELLRRQCPNYDAKGKKIDLSRAWLFGIFMEGAILNGCTFYETVFEEAALSGIRFEDCVFTRANFKGADLKKATFQNSNLAEAQLWLADLSEAKMMRARLFRANLRDADLEKADLTKANLFGADLTRASLINATLSSAYLKKTNLRMANLSHTCARGAWLSGAYLKGASLNSAVFDDAYFTNAVLTNADLTNARFVGAELKNANLDGANLNFANFSNAKYLEKEQLEGANFSKLIWVNGEIIDRRKLLDCMK